MAVIDEMDVAVVIGTTWKANCDAVDHDHKDSAIDRAICIEVHTKTFLAVVTYFRLTVEAHAYVPLLHSYLEAILLQTSMWYI
jgi:hypothetical protein